MDAAVLAWIYRSLPPSAVTHDFLSCLLDGIRAS